LQAALKIVRQIFPYRDTCAPFVELSQEQQGKSRLCFHAQIGLCPGVCTGAVSATDYRKTVKRIALFFGGKKVDLVKNLEREMKVAAKELQFEEAHELKKLLFDLGHIRDIALMKADRDESSVARIEAYDTAHLQGEATVGVMTVVQHALAKKSEYRLFKLRLAHGGNDLSALEEILTRRLAHSEWLLPELIVVDGALLQSDVATRILKKKGLTIPVVGVVKNAQHRPDHLIGPRGLVKRFEKDILLANAEAHRFAIGFHRKKKREQFLSD
jgi:excinuclease ABC subunit C